jgi:hypothetical protein
LRDERRFNPDESSTHRSLGMSNSLNPCVVPCVGATIQASMSLV